MRRCFRNFRIIPTYQMEQRSRWTIRHAISMTLGIEWNEDLSYDDPRNGQTAMDRAADPYRHVLGQPIVGGSGRAVDLLWRRHRADREDL